VCEMGRVESCLWRAKEELGRGVVLLCGDYSILRGGWGLICWLRCATGDEMKIGR